MSYSLEKFRKGKDSLEPSEEKKLAQFREIQARWRQVPENPGMLQPALVAWAALRESFRPSRYKYEFGGEKREHRELEAEYSETKEGQLIQAQDEAGFFNDAFNVRSERLRKAAENREANPKEYEEAFASFDALVKDLSDGDLKNYEQSILVNEIHNDMFGEKPRDLKSDEARTKEREAREAYLHRPSEDPEREVSQLIDELTESDFTLDDEKIDRVIALGGIRKLLMPIRGRGSLSGGQADKILRKIDDSGDKELIRQAQNEWPGYRWRYVYQREMGA